MCPGLLSLAHGMTQEQVHLYQQQKQASSPTADTTPNNKKPSAAKTAATIQMLQNEGIFLVDCQ